MDTLSLQNWRFHLGEVPEAFQRSYDDTNWRQVTLPHDWSVELPFSRENSSGSGYLSGGIGWYRCRFSLSKPESDPGPVFLQFDGVYKNSRVWCNGYYLGERPSGYTGFRYDISHSVRFGEENIVSVRVDHTDLADSRWFTGSGIYRKVTVERAEPVYFPQEEAIFLAEPNLSDGSAAVDLLAAVTNTLEVPVWGTVTASLLDQAGTVCLSLTRELALEEGSSAEVSLDGIMENALLWSPEQPNLYTLSLRFDHDHGTTEADPVCVGVRNIRLDPNEGFFLNGKSTKMKGVCVHHDAGCLGAAVYPAVWRRRLETLKKCGCNAIRMSHNPHMPELYDLCDEMGFLVMEEAFDEWEAPKNKWSTGHNVYPPKHQGYAEAFPEWHERDLTAMVKRGRNHPSIVMWSVGNEIDYPNDPYCHPLFEEMTGNNDANKPSAERQYNPDKPNAERMIPIARELVSIVKAHDTTRPVLLASAFPELSSQIGLFEPFDAMGYNYKEHLYREDHERFPDLPLLGSENGHSTPAWLAVWDNPYISGQFLWTGIDYLGEAHGWPIFASPAGLLDMAGFPKMAWLRRGALWSDAPWAALGTRALPESSREELQPWDLLRGWSGTPGQVMQVICYTNLDSAELFLGGESLGEKRRDGNCEYIGWEVPFRGEALRVKAIGAPGEKEDRLLPALPGVQLAAKLWEPETLPTGQWRDLYPDILQIEVSLLDENGQLCAQEEPLLSVEVSGGRLLGIENGDVADLTDYAAIYRRLHQGRLITYVLPDKGESPVVTVDPCLDRGHSSLLSPVSIQ
ncbi:MAG: glycoside hydrolase family 2 TIM barrel-domain containing protein [Oscillospiraceae bacterium]